MDFFYAFNDVYAPLAGISIFSILENNKSCKSIRFFIVDNGISEKNRNKIENIINAKGRKVSFYEMPNLTGVLGEQVDIGRWNINVYSKLFVGSILPQDVHKVISIDCDTVVVKSIEDLWDTNISKYLVAGVNEPMSKYYRRYLGKNDSDYYLNSGLLMFNVDAIRKEQFEKVIQIGMKKYGGNLQYLDQDLINAIVPQNRIFALSPKFNAITPIFCCEYGELLKVRRVSNYYSKKEFLEAKHTPSIIHFTTFFMNDLRPWFEGSNHPKLGEYMRYKMSSPWSDEKPWKDKRKGTAKLKASLISWLPRFAKCQISSVLHGVVVPKRNLRKICIKEQ